MQLQPARDLAVKICYRLQPFCDRLNIAGSIRRQKPEVKDMEIVCLPKWEQYTPPSLFGDAAPKMILNGGFISTVHDLGHVIKGRADGRYMQIELPEGINLDLFMPEPSDYFRQYAIRTGDAHYAHLIIAKGWIKKGWCGSDKGLRKQRDCQEKKGPDGKSKWVCVNLEAELPPVWESEEDFFNWIEVEYKHPKMRTL